MVFPGVLRGRPEPRLATTPMNQPRRSLSSPGVRPMIRGAGTKATRAESLEEPSFRSPKLPDIRAAGPRTSVASLFATRFRVAPKITMRLVHAQGRSRPQPRIFRKKAPPSHARPPSNPMYARARSAAFPDRPRPRRRSRGRIHAGCASGRRGGVYRLLVALGIGATHLPRTIAAWSGASRRDRRSSTAAALTVA